MWTILWHSLFGNSRGYKFTSYSLLHLIKVYVKVYFQFSLTCMNHYIIHSKHSILAHKNNSQWFRFLFFLRRLQPKLEPVLIACTTFSTFFAYNNFSVKFTRISGISRYTDLVHLICSSKNYSFATSMKRTLCTVRATLKFTRTVHSYCVIYITHDCVRVSLNMSCSPLAPQSPVGHRQFCMKRDSSLPEPSSFSRVKLNTSAHTSRSRHVSRLPLNLCKQKTMILRIQHCLSSIFYQVFCFFKVH